jgi:hypothetical protein
LLEPQFISGLTILRKPALDWAWIALDLARIGPSRDFAAVMAQTSPRRMYFGILSTYSIK